MTVHRSDGDDNNDDDVGDNDGDDTEDDVGNNDGDDNEDDVGDNDDKKAAVYWEVKAATSS